MWVLLAAGGEASVIDSGVISTNWSHYQSDALWTVSMNKQAPMPYSVYFQTTGGMGFNCTPICDQSLPYLPPQTLGATATLSGGIVPDYGAFGNATISGSFYPQVTFYWYDTTTQTPYWTGIHLQSDAFTIAPGDFFVPFTMTGTLYAGVAGAPGNPPTVLLSDPIEGGGYVHFSISQPGGAGSPLYLDAVNVGTSPATQFAFVFTPEPTMTVPIVAALAVVALAIRRRKGAR